jgi:type II secretory pathway predicted ATPase ExeA
MYGDLDGFDHDLEKLVDASHAHAPREQVHETSADPLKMFRLAAQPFADNVNPEFFFRTEAHEEAFLAMKQCIEEHVSWA